MESMSRITLYNNMLKDKQFQEMHKIILDVNISVLSDVEEEFLTLDVEPNQKYVNSSLVLESLNVNVSKIRERMGGEKKVIKLLDKLGDISIDYSKKRQDDTLNSRYIFNRIIKELSAFNLNYFKDTKTIAMKRERGDRTQVFLSYAYDDRLYTLALFEYFYELGIYLYVDWMHNSKVENGTILKSDLELELKHSKQLLFLRSINSELNIEGKQMVRSWCAWELGNFYGKDSSQKYMLNLYSVDNYERTRNIQLHGLKLYKGVSNGLLIGDEIVF